MDSGRRRFLRRVTATAAVTAGAAIVLPAPHPEQRVDRPTEVFAGEPEAVEDEIETPYALWQYSREGGAYEPTSPINVVATLAGSDRTFDDVMAVIDDAGWVRRPAEYVRYAYDVHNDRYDRQHATAAQTLHGAFGRHHIRAWDFEGYVSIQAHEDTAATPEHEIVSYESTKHLLEWCFDEAGWEVQPDGALFDNAAAPDHEGLVTVILP